MVNPFKNKEFPSQSILLLYYMDRDGQATLAGYIGRGKTLKNRKSDVAAFQNQEEYFSAMSLIDSSFQENHIPLYRLVRKEDD